MSRCAHEQGGVKLRRLPRCSRCNIEFLLVLAYYEGSKRKVYEWECPKCHRNVAKDMLAEEPPSKWEQFLHERCKVLNDRQQKDNRYCQ
jgi:hypothetical protein